MKIGVFFGSRSPEHDVSIITGQLIIKGLKDLGHDVVPVYISKEGIWYADSELGNLEFFKDKEYSSKLRKYKVNLNLGVNGRISLIRNSILGTKDFQIDLAFPAFHGQNGEDGTAQGLFELLNIPYVGCDVTSSAVAMDKVLTKQMYQNLNIPTTKFIHFSKKDWFKDTELQLKDIESTLKYPMFVKPPSLGSSIGISKVENKQDLEYAIEVALHYDSKVLIEEGVQNLVDITVAVIGNDDLIVSEIQESTFSDEFFSYEEKYINDGGTQLGNADKKIIIPARLDKNVTEEIKEKAKEIYKAIGCSGISRVDFLYDSKSNKYYANEINTLPGTIYHHLWKESGIDLAELLTKLITYAQERFDDKSKINYTFESEILSKSNSKKLGSKLSS